MAFITVDATVDRIFYENKGFAIVESYTDKTGKERRNYLTAWFDQPQTLQVGDTATFSGVLSTEIDSWISKDGEPKQGVKVSINKARAKVTGSDPVAVVKDVLGFAPEDAPF